MPERPLDPVPTLKFKFATLLLAAVGVTVVVFWAGVRLGVWPGLSGTVAALCALVCVRFLARGVTSPLREMAGAADAMTPANPATGAATSSEAAAAPMSRLRKLRSASRR